MSQCTHPSQCTHCQEESQRIYHWLQIHSDLMTFKQVENEPLSWSSFDSLLRRTKIPSEVSLEFVSNLVKLEFDKFLYQWSNKHDENVWAKHWAKHWDQDQTFHHVVYLIHASLSQRPFNHQLIIKPANLMFVVKKACLNDIDWRKLSTRSIFLMIHDRHHPSSHL